MVPSRHVAGDNRWVAGVEQVPAGEILLRRPLIDDELDDLRNQRGGHDHDGLSLGQESRLVFRDLLVFGLIVVVAGKLADSLFIPARGVRLFF